jgi:hypothetical protein
MAGMSSRPGMGGLYGITGIGNQTKTSGGLESGHGSREYGRKGHGFLTSRLSLSFSFILSGMLGGLKPRALRTAH